MSEFTMEDLRKVMREAAGDDEHLQGDVIDADFASLGYDSLALLEAAARIQRTFGVQIRDEDVADIETPRAFLELVNSRLAQVA